MTKNLGDRLFRHNNGYEKTTKLYAPFELIYTEEAEDGKKARAREKYLKSGVGKEFLKSLNTVK
jgi:putative endonuclease